MNFMDQLERQLGFLAVSTDLYEKGQMDEAIRIATCLRIIFYSSKTCTSLLRHIGAEDIRVLSTWDHTPTEDKFFPNLTNIQINPVFEQAEFVPKLSAAKSNRFVPYTTWWEKEVVYQFPGFGGRLSRSWLVRAAANKDGGTHVDATLDRDYEMLLKGAGWTMTLNPTGGSTKQVPFKNAHFSALRQMAFEVFNSPELTELVADERHTNASTLSECA